MPNDGAMRPSYPATWARWRNAREGAERDEMKLHYIDNSGASRIADLSILADGLHIEADVLGSMDIYASGTGIHRVNNDLLDDDQPERALAALAAGADAWADTAEVAAWWINYVEGVNDTSDDVVEIECELAELSDDDLLALAIAVGANQRTIASGHTIMAITEWLHGSWVEYDEERPAFEERLDELRAAMAAQSA